ncbi:U3 small nucleolar ribonucleoprotein mpp10, putative [Entamoeba invadens IP1]|uniref:U3 small nucleolar ribonucleoprotein mpp10, putative n=1 Tax=Entamoeba invadens IP1 TaxID=370355 RepID=A0A0A1UE87_ENTIV|nr:U3 small nucleolar ribonucleoprotein mpp10, putative [Entamoeba invadens IP1]ELP92091.1 U3 small nucleolar ribonucleoprotein mpp10, putative [Entamoeba invadens IP1]|eukprot:XP_004258862.1 U3 small nucleolar ribonucleoprotein mpp10, putative [Entamoeba invadens IP1]
MECEDVKRLIGGLVENPTQLFPSVQKDVQTKIREAMKFILKYYNIEGVIIDGFTDEQIYYEIKEFNEKVMKEIKKFSARVEPELPNVKRVPESDNSEQSESQEKVKDNEDLGYMDEEIDINKMNDDLDDLENVIEENEKNPQMEEDDEHEDEDDDEEDLINPSHLRDGKEKNDFEKQKELIKSKITKLEEENLKKKHWSMLGEVAAYDRPADSLVELDIDFKNTNRPPPQMTQQQTESLEDMIRRRIKEQTWDDVIRKKLVEKNEKEEFEVDQEKDQMGLGEYYDNKYRKEIFGDFEKDKELGKEKKEVMEEFNKVMKLLEQFTSSYKI